MEKETKKERKKEEEEDDEEEVEYVEEEEEGKEEEEEEIVQNKTGCQRSVGRSKRANALPATHKDKLLQSVTVFMTDNGRCVIRCRRQEPSGTLASCSELFYFNAFSLDYLCIYVTVA